MWWWWLYGWTIGTVIGWFWLRLVFRPRLRRAVDRFIAERDYRYRIRELKGRYEK